MKAMVFAAGLGSRLGEITQTIPKCLVEVAGKTMLEHVVDRLKQAKVDSIIINLFHLGEQIEAFVVKKKSFGIKVEFSKEDELLGTGGGLKKAQDFLKGEEAFFVYNSDVYCDLNLNKLLEFQLANNALASLVTMQRQSSRCLLFDTKNYLAGWEGSDIGEENLLSNDPVLNRLAFSGIQCVSPRLFDFMKEEEGKFSIIRSYMHAAKSGEKILSYLMQDTFWIDVGRPETLEELRNKLK